MPACCVLRPAISRKLRAAASDIPHAACCGQRDISPAVMAASWCAQNVHGRFACRQIMAYASSRFRSPPTVNVVVAGAVAAAPGWTLKKSEKPLPGIIEMGFARVSSTIWLSEKAKLQYA